LLQWLTSWTSFIILFLFKTMFWKWSPVMKCTHLDAVKEIVLISAGMNWKVKLKKAIPVTGHGGL
jgi:hypothetical protein